VRGSVSLKLLIANKACLTNANLFIVLANQFSHNQVCLLRSIRCPATPCLNEQVHTFRNSFGTGYRPLIFLPFKAMQLTKPKLERKVLCFLVSVCKVALQPSMGLFGTRQNGSTTVYTQVIFIYMTQQ
jgi:hypothetical protein